MVLLSFIFYIFRIYATFVTFVHQYQQNELSPLTLNHRTLEKDYDMRLEIQIGAKNVVGLNGFQLAASIESHDGFYPCEKYRFR